MAAVDPAGSKDSQMSVDLVIGGNDNVSNTVVVETTQMQSLAAPARSFGPVNARNCLNRNHSENFFLEH